MRLVAQLPLLLALARARALVPLLLWSAAQVARGQLVTAAFLRSLVALLLLPMVMAARRKSLAELASVLG